MFSVVISIISFSNKTGLKCFYTCTPFQCIHLFLHAYCSELCSQQDAVISEVALYKRLLNWSNSKCYKKKFSFLRGRKKQKKFYKIFVFFLLLLIFFVCLFVNQDISAIITHLQTAARQKWQWKGLEIQLHTTGCTTPSPAVPSLAPQEAAFCGHSC